MWDVVFLVVLICILLLAVVFNINTGKKTNSQGKERWVDFMNMPPDECWELARNIINMEGRFSSQSILEKAGFEFIALKNENNLWVKPPAGWKKIARENFWFDIVDKHGKIKFTYYNDGDYAELYVE